MYQIYQFIIRGERGISYLPQEPSIFRGMNVEDNIMSIIEIIENDKSKHIGLY